MKRITLILALLTTLFSCDHKFPDHIEKEDGIYMKLLSFEESNNTFQQADYAIVGIEVLDKNELIYKRYKEDAIDLENSPFNFLLKYMNEGDSSSFMVATQKIKDQFLPVRFNEAKSDFVEVRIKVHHYYSLKDYDEQRKGYDKEMVEQLLLNKYLEEVDAKPKKGIYKQQLSAGKGRGIKKGDIITIHYKGYFIDRLEFDNTYKRNAFTFTYGTPDQVIKGLDIAIKGMKKGEKSKIIIPSQLAFGEDGSTTLIIPSFSTVIYELEIVNIK